MGIKFTQPTTEDTQTTLQSQRNMQRDEDLLALDAIVEPKVKEWEAAGKPVATVKDSEENMVQNPFAVFIRLAVPKDQVADFKQNMVRRSCLLYGTDPVYYANSPDAEGFTAVKWTFTDHETESQKKKRLAELAKMEAAEKAAAKTPDVADLTEAPQEPAPDVTPETDADWAAEGEPPAPTPTPSAPKRRGGLLSR